MLADDASKTARTATIYGQLEKQVDTVSASLAQQYKIPPGEHVEMSDLAKQLLTVVSDQMSWEKTEPVFIKIYAEVFDESEIDGLLAICRSPTGQTFVAKSLLILREFIQQHHLQKP